MDYSKICDDTIQLVKAVGKFIKSESQVFTREDVKFKGRNDLVTYVDKESERRLIDGLHQILPEAGFMAEEDHQDFEDNKTLNWIIDPLDGTLNFVHQIPVYSISVALMDRDKVRLGVVYELNLEECYHAFDGSDAYLNGNVISVSTNDQFENALFATGFPFTDQETVNFYTDILNHLLANTRGIRRIGSAAVDLCYTAAGRFDCYYEFNLKAWDVAAGAFILQKAGGDVYDFEGGNNYLFDGQILGGNPHISQDLLALFNEKYKNLQS